jgi:hypothetical protein
MPTGFDETERTRLEWLFRGTLIYLALVLGGALLYAADQVRAAKPRLFLLCVAAGIAGSATGALVSALDRHANGFEDKKGDTTPESSEKKERFSERMFYWFVMRPWLGAVVATGVFWGLASGQWPEAGAAASFSTSRVALYGLVTGLFAKSLLDILRNIPKNVFRQ